MSLRDSLLAAFSAEHATSPEEFADIAARVAAAGAEPEELRSVSFDFKPSCYCGSSFDGEGDGVCQVHRWGGLEAEYDELEYALAVDPEDLSIVVCESQEPADPIEMKQWIPHGVLVQRRVTCSPWERSDVEEITE